MVSVSHVFEYIFKANFKLWFESGQIETVEHKGFSEIHI